MRCADWLEDGPSLIDGKDFLVRCDQDKAHVGEHTHGRFAWSVNGWNEQVGPAVVDEIARSAAEAGDEEARAFLDERKGET